MVGGSRTLPGGGPTSSTEIYQGGKWTLVGILPAALTGVRGVVLDNTVYMMGGVGKRSVISDVFYLDMIRS